MDLLDRATLTFYDLRGDYSRERKDQLLGPLDRKYAAGDVVQIQIVRRDWEGAKQAANIADDWTLHKQNSAPFSTKKSDLWRAGTTHERARRCVIRVIEMLFHFTATVDDTRHRR